MTPHPGRHVRHLDAPTPTTKAASRGDIMRGQQRVIQEQAALIDFLRGALEELDLDPPKPEPDLLDLLTPQCRALLAVLWRAYPEPVDRVTLEALMPGHDHAREQRQLQIADLGVYRIRKALGQDCIQAHRGLGWSMSPELHARLQGLVT